MASLIFFLLFDEFWRIRKILVNMVNLMNFIESGWISLKIPGSDKIVNGKVSQSEVLTQKDCTLHPIFTHTY